MESCRVTSDLRQFESAQDRLNSPGMISMMMEKRNHDEKSVFALADTLLSSVGSVWVDGQKWSHEHVLDGLHNHPLYSKAMRRLNTDKDPSPLHDLQLRVARRLACFILRIDPDYIGVGE